MRRPRRNSTSPAGDGSIVFARRLTAARVEKGWNQSELARRAAAHMHNKKFNRDNVSKYESGTLPRPVHLNALAKALGMKADELLPSTGRLLTDDMTDTTPDLTFRTVGEGMAWLRINQRLPVDAAMKIITILREANASDT